MDSYDKIDIGNVRGIQGEKGAKGEQGNTPSYDDIRYKKKNGRFEVLTTDSEITPIDLYVDANRKLCNSEGYLYDENMDLTDEKGEPYDYDTYGYEYERLYKDEDDRITNRSGELLDGNYNIQYVLSSFLGDILAYLFADSSAYNHIVNDIFPHVADSLSDTSNSDYQAFFDLIEGDIKYYVCADDPKTSIYMSSGTLVNNCKYKDENGNVVVDGNNNPVHVPLEKNALYLYKVSNADDNDIMHYDIYVCLKANTVPKKLVSSADFEVTYNVLDSIGVSVTDVNLDNENEVWLNIRTKGSGEVYTKDDFDTLDVTIIYSNNTTDTVTFYTVPEDD